MNPINNSKSIVNTIEINIITKHQTPEFPNLTLIIIQNTHTMISYSTLFHVPNRAVLKRSKKKGKEENTHYLLCLQANTKQGTNQIIQ